MNGDLSYSEIGFICDRNGKCQGVSTIGTTRSFFDQEFRSAKEKITLNGH